MVLKPIHEYTVEEVGMWLTAQGLGDHASKFIDAGVNGDVLVSLDVDDLKNDLLLSGLQAKKVLSNIEFSKGMHSGGGGAYPSGENERKLEQQVQTLESALQSKEQEIAELNKRLARLECGEGSYYQQQHQPQSTYHPQQPPQPTTTYATTTPNTTHYYHESKPQQPPAGVRVVGGAARGAAGGAIKGAIVGAILPGMDAGDGAAAGAAVGAFSGGVGGLRGRRRF